MPVPDAAILGQSPKTIRCHRSNGWRTVTPPLVPLMAVLLVSLVTFMLTPSLVLLLPNLIFSK
jgi:hypothetical protein